MYSSTRGSITLFFSVLISCILIFITVMIHAGNIEYSTIELKGIVKLSVQPLLGEFDRDVFDRYGLKNLWVKDPTVLQSNAITYLTKNSEPISTPDLLCKKGNGAITALLTSPKFELSKIQFFKAWVTRQLNSLYQDKVNITSKRIDKWNESVMKVVYSLPAPESVSITETPELLSNLNLYIAKAKQDIGVFPFSHSEPTYNFTATDLVAVTSINSNYEKQYDDFYTLPDPTLERSEFIKLDLNINEELLSKNVGNTIYQNNISQVLRASYIKENHPQEIRCNSFFAETCSNRKKSPFSTKEIFRYSQTEFLLGSNTLDTNNKNFVAEQFLYWRMGMNYIAAQNMPDVRCTVDALQDIGTNNDGISLFQVWIFLESVDELNRVLNGEKIQWLKTQKEEWTYYPETLGFTQQQPLVSDGLSYQDSLEVLMLFAQDSVKWSAMAELIQSNLSKIKGQTVSLSNLYSGLEVSFEIQASLPLEIWKISTKKNSKINDIFVYE